VRIELSQGFLCQRPAELSLLLVELLKPATQGLAGNPDLVKAGPAAMEALGDVSAQSAGVATYVKTSSNASPGLSAAR